MKTLTKIYETGKPKPQRKGTKKEERRKINTLKNRIKIKKDNSKREK